MKFLKPLEFKAFSLALGISVGFLVMAFLVPLYMEHLNKERHPIQKTPPGPQTEKRYTEVRGMN